MANPFLTIDPNRARPNAQTTSLERLQNALDKRAPSYQFTPRTSTAPSARTLYDAQNDPSMPVSSAYRGGWGSSSFGGSSQTRVAGRPGMPGSMPAARQPMIPGPNGYTVANKDQSRLAPGTGLAFVGGEPPNPAISAIGSNTRDLSSIYAGMVGRSSAGFTGPNTLPVDSATPLNMPQPAGGMQPPMGQPQQAMTRQQQRRAMIAARPRRVEDNPIAAAARARGQRSYTNSNGALMPLTSIGGGARNTYGD